LTDPSYAGQILVFTYPLIGNYGVAEASSWESKKIHVQGVVMSELAPHFSNYSAEGSLLDWLKDQKVPFLVGVDTRALTKRLRKHGVIPGAISPIHKKPDHFENFASIDWVKNVSIQKPELYGEGLKKIIAIDCGMKENIMRSLLNYPIQVKRVPFNY